MQDCHLTVSDSLDFMLLALCLPHPNLGPARMIKMGRYLNSLTTPFGNDYFDWALVERNVVII